MKPTEKKLEQGKLKAKRVFPSLPLSHRDALPHCAGAVPPHPPPQPPVATAAAAPAPLPLPPTPGPLLSHPPLPSVPLPFSMSARNRFASMCLCVVRAAVRALAPLPSFRTPQISGCKLQELSLFLLLGAGSLGCSVSRTAQWVSPLFIIHFHSHPSILGCKPRFQVILCNWVSSEEGAKGEGTTATPRPFTCLMPKYIGGSDLHPIASELSQVWALSPSRVKEGILLSCLFCFRCHVFWD